MKAFLPAILLAAGLFCASGHAQQSDDAALKFQKYQAKAVQGDAVAQYRLGLCYYKGDGVAKNDAEAVTWLRKAAEQGYAKAQLCLGWDYAHGEGVAKNDAEAVTWIRKAAEQGAADAQYMLSTCYSNGQGVAKDDAEAVKWMGKAAEQGYAVAQYGLGLSYYKGDGVVKDYAESARWMHKAAEQGYAQAQLCLGWDYAHGEGVEMNKAEAVKWYRSAAEQGYTPAQNMLGWCYAHGEGVEMNKVEAEKWVRLSKKALAQGDAKPPAVPMPVAEVPSAFPTGVDMVREDGILKVPVQINGVISLKFIVDSGASEVQIPKDVYLTLIRAETIHEKDFLPGTTVTLADGSKVKSNRFVLRSIKVGELTFSDVQAVVGGLEAPLLLGQSFLSRFSEWKIDNKTGKLMLTK